MFQALSVVGPSPNGLWWVRPLVGQGHAQSYDQHERERNQLVDLQDIPTTLQSRLFIRIRSFDVTIPVLVSKTGRVSDQNPWLILKQLIIASAVVERPSDG